MNEKAILDAMRLRPNQPLSVELTFSDSSLTRYYLPRDPVAADRAYLDRLSLTADEIARLKAHQ